MRMTINIKGYKMAKKKVRQITRVALVIDRSGSMQSILQPARDAILEQVNTIKANLDKCDDTYLTVVSFDSSVEEILNGVRVTEDLWVDPKEILIPRGLTAMNDGVMKAIQLLSDKRATSGTAYLVIVVSDGMENSSTIKTPQLSEKIKELEATGRWTFTFMLANQDIHEAAKNLNLDWGNVAAFDASTNGVVTASTLMVNSMNTYFSSRSKGVLRSSTYYQSNT